MGFGFIEFKFGGEGRIEMVKIVNDFWVEMLDEICNESGFFFGENIAKIVILISDLASERMKSVSDVNVLADRAVIY